MQNIDRVAATSDGLADRRAPTRPCVHGLAEDDEGELAAARQQQRRLERAAGLQAESRASPKTTAAFNAAPGPRRPCRGSPPASAASSGTFRPMPTETKNRPSSRPLNGSMVTSTSWRNSVSASSRPAMKAPSAIDRPVSALTRPAPITTSRQAAMNSSSLLARATDFSIGRSSRRPKTNSATTPSTAGSEGQQHAAARRARPSASAQDGQGHEDRRHGQVLEQQHGEGRAPGHGSAGASARPGSA